MFVLDKKKPNMNCKSKNIIYCMTCDGCGENYIGQTGTKLADRMMGTYAADKGSFCSLHSVK